MRSKRHHAGQKYGVQHQDMDIETRNLKNAEVDVFRNESVRLELLSPISATFRQN